MSERENRPRLAMVSTWVRRDLQDPLRHFRRLEVIHLYRQALDDLEPAELRGAIRYRTPLDLVRRLRQSAPDLIQGVEPFGLLPIPYLLAGWLAARQQQVPLLVVTLENRPLEVKYGRWAAAILRRFLRWYFGQAGLIVYLNDGARRNLLHCGAPASRTVRTMYGTWGVDVDEFGPGGPRHVEPGFDRMVLFVGRLVRGKGIYDLVEAFRRVVDRAPGVGLLIVGDGAERQGLEGRVRELGLQARVRLAGGVRNRDLPPLLRGASVFASPSLTTRQWEEQVGMANLQAMACGTPVVSTRSGAIPEYVADGVTGLLVPEHSPEQLAQAILRVLAEPELAARLSAAGLSAVRDRYDAQKNVAAVEQLLLDRCLPRRLGPAPSGSLEAGSRT